MNPVSQAFAKQETDRAAGVVSELHPAGPHPLVATGISKQWKRTPQPVLDDVSLRLDPGEIAWIGGENGVGKTTFLRIAAGLILPDSGEVLVAGIERAHDRRAFQRALGFLSAGDKGLYARLTTRDHLNYWAGLSLIPRGEREGYVARSIERFALDPLLLKRLDRMSMGQRQRVRLAMTFLHEPSLVLLDEPLNSLDPSGAELLAGAIQEVLDRGGAALWCSPAVEDAGIPFAGLYRLESGRLAQA